MSILHKLLSYGIFSPFSFFPNHLATLSLDSLLYPHKDFFCNLNEVLFISLVHIFCDIKEVYLFRQSDLILIILYIIHSILYFI